MLTSKRTDVSSHPWVVSYDSSLWRYWGRCYLGDSASTPLLRHVLLLLPDHPQVCAFSHLPCFGSNPLMLLTMSFSFYFDPFPMPSLNHSALSPYITKFLNWNYSHMSIWTQHWSFPSCPPPHTSGRHPVGLGLTLHWVTRKHWAPSLLLVDLVATFLLLMTQHRSFSP